MNSHIIEGNWNVLKGKMRQQWGKLTDSDIESIKGSAEEAVGRLQKAYGYSKDQAELEYRKFRDSNTTLFSNETDRPIPSDRKI